MTSRCGFSFRVVTVRITEGIAAACLLWAGSAGAPSCGAEPVAVTLAEDGRALQAVVVGERASARTRKAAADLTRYLGRITGATFDVVEGDGSEGITVGSVQDFPDFPAGNRFAPEDPFRREEYLLQTHRKGVLLIGATDLAAQHAVWDLLYRLGYRQFFPTESWEIVPHADRLRVSVDVLESPDYVSRMGPRPPAWGDRTYWRRWHDRNRMTAGFSLSTGHAYGGIVRANRKAFQAHPEYFALVNGKRRRGGNAKFCIGNPGLRKLVVDYAVRRMKASPGGDSLSMDPSDGGGWCECDACRALGSVSDRAITLANEVAAAINALGIGEKYVGMYAYNEHSPPPTIEVHPNVVVSIATSFIRGGYTVNELVEGWSERCELLGIRDYFGTHVWWQAMPRRSRGGNVNYLISRIPYFHDHGARFMNACAADSWGADGLGYYVAGRLLWDVNEADRIDGIIEDFLETCFAEAKEPMREFYRLVSRRDPSLCTSGDLLARMYRHLDAARELTDDPAVTKRLDELVLFARYVELMFAFTAAGSDAAREQAAQDVFRHAYRMRDTLMAYPQALYRWLKREGVAVPGEANPGRLTVGSAGHDAPPWKSAQPFSDEEIEQFLEQGVAKHEVMVMDFDPVTFSEDLVPAAETLALRHVPTGNFGRDNKFRGRYRFFTWLRPPEQSVSLDVTGGLIERYRDRGNVKFQLYAAKEATLEPVDTDASTPPDGTTYTVVLESPHDGLHEVVWSDGDDMTLITWPEGHPMTVKSGASLRDNRTLYFYVPKGTETLGGYTTSARMRILDGDGNRMLGAGAAKGGAGYFKVSVPEGQDGALWKMERCYGTQILMTVPPYLARNERELLLPREVVERDRQAPD